MGFMGITIGGEGIGRNCLRFSHFKPDQIQGVAKQLDADQDISRRDSFQSKGMFADGSLVIQFAPV